MTLVRVPASMRPSLWSWSKRQAKEEGNEAVYMSDTSYMWNSRTSAECPTSAMLHMKCPRLMALLKSKRHMLFVDNYYCSLSVGN